MFSARRRCFHSEIRQGGKIPCFSKYARRQQVFQDLSLSLSLFISLRITDRSPNNTITGCSDILKHSSKNTTRYYIYLVLIQNKLYFLLPHKDTPILADAWPPCKMLSCSLAKKKLKLHSSTIKPAALSK